MNKAEALFWQTAGNDISWLRSGRNIGSMDAFYLTADGGWYTAVVSTPNAVRRALANRTLKSEYERDTIKRAEALLWQTDRREDRGCVPVVAIMRVLQVTCLLPAAIAALLHQPHTPCAAL